MVRTTKREPKTRREQAEHVVERLRGFNVRINASSRIGRMLGILRRTETIEPDHPDYPIVLEFIRDMYQLRLIVDTMDAHRGSREFHMAVSLLRKDCHSRRTNARTLQAAITSSSSTSRLICTNGGIPTRHIEPSDVICDIEGGMLGSRPSDRKRLRPWNATSRVLRTRLVRRVFQASSHWISLWLIIQPIDALRHRWRVSSTSIGRKRKTTIYSTKMVRTSGNW